MMDWVNKDWISVEDKLPDNNNPVLAWTSGSWPYKAAYEDGRWYIGSDSYQIKPPTHWLPFPTHWMPYPDHKKEPK